MYVGFIFNDDLNAKALISTFRIAHINKINPLYFYNILEEN